MHVIMVNGRGTCACDLRWNDNVKGKETGDGGVGGGGFSLVGSMVVVVGRWVSVLSVHIIAGDGILNGTDGK